MSGHSKWAQIKRKKGVTDARRGQLFTKLTREIIVAAKQGGGDQTANFRLRMAVQKARDSSMPFENIERAIKRAVGEGTGADSFHEVTYEGYAPGGAAVLIQALTDNKNRTISEVRKVFNKANAALGEQGCVGWLFTAKGTILAEAPQGKADDLALAVIDAGAEDVKVDGSSLEVQCAPEKLEILRQALEAEKATIASAEIQMVPSTVVPLDPKPAEQTLRLLDHLEELDDVQKVYTNADFPDEVLANEAAGSAPA